jgi:adenylate cyclase
MALGITQMHSGEAAAARGSFEQALALHNPRQRAAYAVIHPLDLSMVCLVHLSWCLWVLGYPTQAVKRSRAAVGAADRTAQPADRACAIAFASFLHMFRREERRARDMAASAIRLSSEYGLHQWWAPSLIAHGWGRAAMGDVAGGIGEMRQGIEAWRSAGAQYAVSIYLAMLADVLGRHGEVDEALDILAEALHIATVNGDQFWEPEIHRLRGEFLLDTVARAAAAAPRQAEEEAAESLERALALARAQQARGLELRAAMSLCRLAPRWGRGDQARERVAQILDGFREGFDTRDLREARALLARI